MYEGAVAEFENKVVALNYGEEAEVKIDSSITKQMVASDEAVLAKLFNPTSFRDFVMVSYETLCAITGTAIRHEKLFNLEAAHIKPKSHGGLFLPNNGIALCRDMHWAFDKGFITLTSDYKVEVHQQATSEWLKTFDGKYIRIPKEQFFQPSIENIKYHRSHVYGLFLTSGRL
jgi:predicted restriction endonuclease